MKRTATMLLLAVALVGCGSNTDVLDDSKVVSSNTGSKGSERFDADLERMRVSNQECLVQADTLLDLQVCEDMLNKRTRQIMDNLHAGTYDE